jgi:drug/metabolite transporter (DMT)-like permease
MAKILIALYVLTTSSALVFLKWGTKTGSPIGTLDGKMHLNLNLYVLMGIFLYGTSFLLYTFLISKYDLGYIIPLTTALVYIVIFLASFVIFKEIFTALKVLGIVFILAGLILLNLKSKT